MLCEFGKDGPAVVVLGYQFKDAKRVTNYRLCADHARRFEATTVVAVKILDSQRFRLADIGSAV